MWNPFKKKYAIKRKFDGTKFWYYPVYSHLELFWDYIQVQTGDTYPLIGPFGVKTIQPVYKKVCFDELEDAKAYIGKIILDSKTEKERRDLIIKLTEDIKPKLS